MTRSDFDSTPCSNNTHSLTSARLVGRSLRYAAELDGQWVALLTFSAASLHLKAREHWIGWSPRQRARRLPFLVNNSRFPVLTDRLRLPNLASRTLALCLRRLSCDWQDRCWLSRASSMKPNSTSFYRYGSACMPWKKPGGDMLARAGVKMLNAISRLKRTSQAQETQHGQAKA